VVFLFLIGAAPVLANGQTTHVWITRTALEHLPAGELKELLSEPDREAALVHGTMFPDGGYAVNHPYGELAHWEPFQDTYLEWITTNFSEPWSEEAATHIAFWMGMASHGMADQFFDALYQDRSQIVDADAGWAEGKSLDEASDVIWANLKGPQEIPEAWLPDTVLPSLFEDQGVDVDAATLEDGQDLLEAAMELVAWMSENDDAVAAYRESFPWGGAHLDDGETAGRPAQEAQVVASYWQVLWRRLQGEDVPLEVLATHPAQDEPYHPRSAEAPESRVTLAFSRPLKVADLEEIHFEVSAGVNRPVGFETWLYYRDDSHLVHIAPTSDWPSERTLLVSVRESLKAADGSTLSEPFTLRFRTGTPPEAEEEEGCGCTAGRRAPQIWVLVIGGILLRRRR